MPEVRRGVRSPSRTLSNDSNPTSPDRRVTFENGRVDSATEIRPNDTRVGSNNSLAQIMSPESRSRSGRRPDSHRHHSDRDREERDAYYDSRAATHSEFRRRASNLQSYYVDHPDLLPQLPFTFRHGFKRWKLAGYIAVMVIDACVVPIVLLLRPDTLNRSCGGAVGNKRDSGNRAFGSSSVYAASILPGLLEMLSRALSLIVSDSLDGFGCRGRLT